MRKILLLLLLLSALRTSAQNAINPSPVSLTASVVKVFTLNATSPTSPPIQLSGSGVAFHRIIWFGLPTLSTCGIEVDSSASLNPPSWGSADVIASQTCTANGSYFTTENEVNNIQLNLSTITGGGNLTVVYLGYQPSPAEWNSGSMISRPMTCSVWPRAARATPCLRRPPLT